MPPSNRERDRPGYQPSESLPLRMFDVASAMEKRWAALLTNTGITPAEFRILAICMEQGACTATDIATLAPVDPSSISRVVHRLVKGGLLTRRRSQVDRRLVTLRLSADGHFLMTNLVQSLEDFSIRMTEGLRARDLQTLGFCLGAIQVTLDSNRS